MFALFIIIVMIIIVLYLNQTLVKTFTSPAERIGTR